MNVTELIAGIKAGLPATAELTVDTVYPTMDLMDLNLTLSGSLLGEIIPSGAAKKLIFAGARAEKPRVRIRVIPKQPTDGDEPMIDQALAEAARYVQAGEVEGVNREITRSKRTTEGLPAGTKISWHLTLVVDELLPPSGSTYQTRIQQRWTL